MKSTTHASAFTKQTSKISLRELGMVANVSPCELTCQSNCVFKQTSCYDGGDALMVASSYRVFHELFDVAYQHGAQHLNKIRHAIVDIYHLVAG